MPLPSAPPRYPNRADAIAEWVVPVIIASGFGGTVFGLGAATTAERNAQYRANAPVAYYPAPAVTGPAVTAPGAVYAAPAPTCWITKAQRPDGRLIDVRVCDPR